MATITLNYNEKSFWPKRLLHILLGTRLFSKAEPVPNKKTLSAIREAQTRENLPEVDTSSVEAMIASVLS